MARSEHKQCAECLQLLPYGALVQAGHAGSLRCRVAAGMVSPDTRRAWRLSTVAPNRAPTVMRRVRSLKSEYTSRLPSCRQMRASMSCVAAAIACSAPPSCPVNTRRTPGLMLNVRATVLLQRWPPVHMRRLQPYERLGWTAAAGAATPDHHSQAAHCPPAGCQGRRLYPPAQRFNCQQQVQQ